jgi:hypothetical protein
MDVRRKLMSKVSKVRKEKRNIGKVPVKRKGIRKKSQSKLSEFFRSSPLAAIELSRDKSH